MRRNGPAGGRNLPTGDAVGTPRTSTSPINTPRTTRTHTARGLTSLWAGKMVPMFAMGLHREDSVVSGRVRLTFNMNETVEVLDNAVNVSVKAYLVPFLAFDRFEGSMDQLNRAWEGVAFQSLPVVPFFETEVAGVNGSNEILKYLGVHAKQGDTINTAYVEAYNKIWNFRAANRSANLQPRNRLEKTLAPAFWINNRFRHIVPDFDQAVIDGEVSLNVVNSKMPVSGIGLRGADTNTSAGGPIRQTDGTSPNPAHTINFATSSSQTQGVYLAARGTSPNSFPEIYAELQADGITVSLSNIEMARKTQAFARLREQYTGLSDDWIINMLMDGLTVPEASLSQPMLVGQRDTVFGMSKRYSSSADDLTASAVTGATFVDLSIQTPRIPCGGIVMIVAEITPDQLFERQKDPWLHAATVDELPHYLRDTLDPEKVEAVPNDYVDVDHATPDAVFGYAPLNYRWQIEAPHIGGKFFRATVDEAFKEDRQRIWTVETKNPTLSQDFYLCTNMNQNPFMFRDQDNFECLIQGDCLIQGNTVFGGVLIEAQENYVEVMSKAPQDRLDTTVKPPPATGTPPPFIPNATAASATTTAAK